MSKKLILSLLGLVFLAFGVIAGVYLVQQQQLLQKKASDDGGTITVTLNPANLNTLQLGREEKIGIYLNNPYHQIAIGSIQLEANYTYDPSQGNPIYAKDPELSPTILEDEQGARWNISYRATEDDQAGNIAIKLTITATSENGYIFPGSTSLHLANIPITAFQPGRIRLTFKAGTSKVFLLSPSQDILQTPNASYTYQTSGYSDPQPTPTTPPGTSPTPIQPSPTLAPTTPPGASPTPTTPPGTQPSPTRTPTPQPGGGTQPTPTTAAGGGAQPTATQAPSAGGTTGIRPITITSPQNGAVLTSTTPTFSGTSSNYASIAINVNSSGPITGSTGADANGNWSWTVPTPLTGGAHTGQFTATDQQGGVTTANVSFSISTAAGTTELPQAGVATYTILLLIIGAGLLGLGFLSTKKLA